MTKRELWIFFAVSVLVIMSAGGFGFILQTRHSDPHLLTEHELWLRTVADLTEIGRRIPPNSPVQRLAARRVYAGDKLCDIATFLFFNDPEQFAGVIDDACEGLWEQWPEQAQYCHACQN